MVSSLSFTMAYIPQPAVTIHTSIASKEAVTVPLSWAGLTRQAARPEYASTSGLRATAIAEGKISDPGSHARILTVILG
jgi:hypothetical protein